MKLNIICFRLKFQFESYSPPPITVLRGPHVNPAPSHPGHAAGRGPPSGASHAAPDLVPLSLLQAAPPAPDLPFLSLPTTGPALASVVVPRAPFPFPLHVVASNQRTRAPFPPSASRLRQWLDHPRPSPDSIKIVPATTAFHDSPPPQQPVVPPPPPSHQAGACRPLEAAGATRAADGHRGECLIGRTPPRRQASLPRRRQLCTVSLATHHLARWVALCHCGARREDPPLVRSSSRCCAPRRCGRACRGDRMSLVPRHPWVGQIGLWAGSPVSGSWAEAGPTLCTLFFSILFIFLEIHIKF
jgi:hypothetical protein